MGRFSIEAIFKAVDRITGPVGRMSASLGKFAKSARASMKGLEDLDIGGGFAKLSGVVAVGAAGAGVAIQQVTKAGMEFEQAITNVGAVSLMTRGQIAELEKKALELGASTKFSATEVAGAMEMMGRAGFTNAQTLSGIEGVLAAAAAEGGDLAETASTISNVLKGMGLEAEDSGRVADVLTLASARTNSSITSLGESMKQLGPVAKQFGIPMEEAVAMAAMLQDVGLDAGQAGTSAASALTKLAKPSKRAQAMIEKMGISFKDTHGNMKPATEVFGEMAKAVGKSGGNMEQAAFFAELVGLESQKAAINLTNAFQSGKGKDLIEELTVTKNTAKEMAALRMNTLGGDIEQLTGNIETLKIGLYQTQAGPLRGIVKEVTAWIDANSGLVKSGVSKFIDDMIPVVQVFGDAFRAAWPAIQESVKWLMGFGKDKNFMLSLQKFAVTLAKVTAFAIGFGLVFAGAVFASLQLVAGVIDVLIGAWDWLIAGIGRAVFAISNFFADLGAKWDVGAGEAVKFLIMGLVNGITAGKELVWKAIKAMGTGAIGALKSVLGIKSPSRPMMEIGGLTADGLGIGWDKRMQKVNANIEHSVALPQVNARSLGSDLAPRPSVQPQIASPQARVASSIEEHRETVRTEVTIRDETGRAEVTKKPPANASVKLRVGASGTF